MDSVSRICVNEALEHPFLKHSLGKRMKITFFQKIGVDALVTLMFFCFFVFFFQLDLTNAT